MKFFSFAEMIDSLQNDRGLYRNFTRIARLGSQELDVDAQWSRLLDSARETPSDVVYSISWKQRSGGVRSSYDKIFVFDGVRYLIEFF